MSRGAIRLPALRSYRDREQTDLEVAMDTPRWLEQQREDEIVPRS